MSEPSLTDVVTPWMADTGNMIFLAVGRNGVANVYCDHHGWIDSGETYDGERAWADVLAAVNEHLAEAHPDLVATNGVVVSAP